MNQPLTRDLLVAATGVLLVTLFAALLIGDTAMFAFLGVVLASSLIGRRTLRRRVAVALAVLLAGAVPALLAHSVFFDHEPLGMSFHVGQTVVQGTTGLGLAVLALIVANTRRLNTS